MIRRLTHDEWLVLGLLGALLGLSLLLVHMPAALWAGNTGEFHWRFDAFLRPGLALLAGGLATAFLILVIVPQTMRSALASLLCAVSLVSWVYGFFLAGHMTALNGIDAPMDFHTRLGAWELAIASATCVLIAVAIAHARRAAITVILVLNLGLVATSAASVQSARHHRVRPSSAQDAGPVFRFSRHDNVLVVLLDGLQSDTADAILRGDPGLAAAFDGFRLYRDTLGVAPTTFVSLPAIHSGSAYWGEANVGAYFDESISARSFMTRFADAGYDAALVNPMEGVCPERVRTCTSAADILRSGEAQLRSERLRLLDVSLFRLAPVWLKERIYDNGSWFLAGRFGLAEETGRIFEHNALLADIGRRMTVDDGPPTIKFVHSLATHTPYVLNDDCLTLSPTSLSKMVPQARCALAAVATVLDALRAARVYDATEVALIADHGIGQPNQYIARVGNLTGPDAEWARRAGFANPMFLMKPRRSHGPLAHDETHVYLPDLGSTLCASSGACTSAAGVPIGLGAPDRPRRFLDYAWQHDFWHLRDIPNMTGYDVRGPLWEEEAWRAAR